MPRSRNILCGGTIARANRCDDKVATTGKPHGDISELYERKEGAFCGLKRNAMIHDDEREGTVSHRADDIGEHG